MEEQGRFTAAEEVRDHGEEPDHYICGFPDHRAE